MSIKSIKCLVIYFILIIISSSTYVVAQTTHVTITYYMPVKAQTNSQPHITSDGSKINLHHLKYKQIKWCAISRDLLYLFPKGKPKRVWIQGFGVWEVRDVMHKRIKHHVDLLIHPQTKNYSNKYNVKIKILK